MLSTGAELPGNPLTSRPRRGSIVRMALQYQKRARVGRDTNVNLSKSGVSMSHGAGPLTVNSRGRASIRLAPGWSFRLGKKQTGPALAVMLILSAVAFVVWVSWLFLKLTWLAVYLPARWTWGRITTARRTSDIP